ncbi:MAG: hypothetical protein CMA59_00620 [Euryarchaeota archaeon]|nr:hypothetical protein [Euryarchaeota archaeon]
MAKQNLNIGVSANDGTGDTLRDGAIKLNNVVDELYAALGDSTNLQITINSPSTNQVLKWNGSTFTEGQLAASNLTDIDVSGVTNGQVLKWNTANARWQPGDDLQGGGGGGSAITNLTNNGSDEVVISTNFLPNTDNAYDLGSSTLRFRDAYLVNASLWLGDTALSTDPVTQEMQRKKQQPHTVNSIDTGATRTVASKLASEDSTQEEKFRLRFNAMKAGTKLEIEDSTGAKAEVDFTSFTAEAGAARGYIQVAATGANQSQELSVTNPVKITSKNRLLSEDETGKVDIGAQDLDFGSGNKLFFDGSGVLEVTGSELRFGASGSKKQLKFDGNDNLILDQDTEIQFGTTHKLAMDSTGNLTVPDGEIRFGSSTRKLKIDSSGNLELPADGEIKIGTKRMKIGTNGTFDIANDGTNFTEVGGGFQTQIGNAPAGASIIKGHDNATIYKPSPTLLYRFTSSGSSAYTVNGPGLGTNVSNAALVFHRGFTYDLHNQAGGSHPLRLQSTSGLSGTEYTTGVSGSNTGMQIITVPLDAPNTLYYQCTAHSAMNGTITVK